MGAFTFHVEHVDREPIVRTRNMAHETDALAYAQQLLSDWPDCDKIDVIEGDKLLTRLRPPRG